MGDFFIRANPYIQAYKPERFKIIRADQDENPSLLGIVSLAAQTCYHFKLIIGKFIRDCILEPASLGILLR